MTPTTTPPKPAAAAPAWTVRPASPPSRGARATPARSPIKVRARGSDAPSMDSGQGAPGPTVERAGARPARRPSAASADSGACGSDDDDTQVVFVGPIALAMLRAESQGGAAPRPASPLSPELQSAAAFEIWKHDTAPDPTLHHYDGEPLSSTTTTTTTTTGSPEPAGLVLPPLLTAGPNIVLWKDGKKITPKNWHNDAAAIGDDCADSGDDVGGGDDVTTQLQSRARKFQDYSSRERQRSARRHYCTASATTRKHRRH